VFGGSAWDWRLIPINSKTPKPIFFKILNLIPYYVIELFCKPR